MRLAVVLALFTACGRVSFDPIASGGDDAGPVGDGPSGDGMFVSPQGIGSTFAPTFAPGASIAVNRVGIEQPGDTMMLGVYLNSQNAQITPPAGWTTVFSMVDVNMFRAAFFERRFAAGDPTTYSFPTSGTTLVSWALVSYRGYDGAALTDTTTFLSGNAGVSSITYITPFAQTRGEVVLLMVDDAGSSGGTGASTWTPQNSLTMVANAYRVVVLHGDGGTAMQSFSAIVNVGGTTSPRGAVWLRAF